MTENDRQFNGFWITPNGKIVEVGYYGHGEYLLKHQNEFNLDTVNDHSLQHIEKALRAGAIHVHIDGRGLEFYMEIEAWSILSIKKHYLEILQISKRFNIIKKRIMCRINESNDIFGLVEILGESLLREGSGTRFSTPQSKMTGFWITPTGKTVEVWLCTIY